ncbi:hypothetical protein, partial [Solimonas marina]|uniref:hypothetical protein n=1 Tax=Solimonas marina TaxID=2714601 RepID=UPI0019D3167D
MNAPRCRLPTKYAKIVQLADKYEASFCARSPHLSDVVDFPAAEKQKNPDAFASGFVVFKTLAVSYFHMAA